MFVCLLPLCLPPGGYRQRRRECDSKFVFCLFVYFLSVYFQVGINKGEGSVTVTAYDEAAQVNPSFKVLKTMVIGWLYQVSNRIMRCSSYSIEQLVAFPC